MPCCCPPRTTTEPISTFTRRFLTAASDPVTSCAQDPPSRDIRASCAWLSERKLSGASTVSSVANRTICSALFNSTTSLCYMLTHNSRLLVDFRQLRQHGARLGLDIRTLILRGQRH